MQIVRQVQGQKLVSLIPEQNSPLITAIMHHLMTVMRSMQLSGVEHRQTSLIVINQNFVTYILQNILSATGRSSVETFRGFRALRGVLTVLLRLQTIVQMDDLNQNTIAYRG